MDKKVSARGLPVEPCKNCGRWTSSGRTCCVPCSNGRGVHQWLCESSNELRRYFPAELLDTTKVCPVCGSFGVYTYDHPGFDYIERRCPFTFCDWREELNGSLDGI